MLTTREAATRLGVNASRVRQLIAEGKIKATKHGRDWDIPDAEVERYQQERKPAGRPRHHELTRPNTD